MVAEAAVAMVEEEKEGVEEGVKAQGVTLVEEAVAEEEVGREGLEEVDGPVGWEAPLAEAMT
eukprot:1559835-Prymnesium_polylepis.1